MHYLRLHQLNKYLCENFNYILFQILQTWKKKILFGKICNHIFKKFQNAVIFIPKLQYPNLFEINRNSIVVAI